MFRIIGLKTFTILSLLCLLSCKEETKNDPQIIDSYDLTSPTNWIIASTPAHFSESALTNELAYGYNRAKLAWYSIDPMFLRNGALVPDHIKHDKDQLSSHLVREVFEAEIFPDRSPAYGEPKALNVLNMAYYPTERGPYNYRTESVNSDGALSNPTQSWGGILRKIESTKFDQYIEFWLMDPFVESNSSSNGGDLYINLGRISEDILKDSRKSFEHGLHIPGVVNNYDTTSWGVISKNINSSGGFNSSPSVRLTQDVGLDGLNSIQEINFFSAYISQMSQKVNLDILAVITEDPSSDDFHSYRGSDFDNFQTSILERYKNYNNHEGNIYPDNEDINKDNKLNSEDAYLEFNISIRPADMNVGQNYIVDKLTSTVNLANQSMSSINWYHFKIPIKDNTSIIGDVSSIDHYEFVRVYLTNFESPIVLRFVEFEMKNE
jgi:cell surface protein SprA